MSSILWQALFAAIVPGGAIVVFIRYFWKRGNPRREARKELKRKLETHRFPSDLKPTALQVAEMLAAYDCEVTNRARLRKIIRAPILPADYEAIARRIFEQYVDETCREYDRRSQLESIPEPA